MAWKRPAVQVRYGPQMFHMEQLMNNDNPMGCGPNCACEAGRDEIVQATSPEGKDITNEVKGNGCSNPDCGCDKDGNCTCGSEKGGCQDGKCQCGNGGEGCACKDGEGEHNHEGHTH